MKLNKIITKLTLTAVLVGGIFFSTQSAFAATTDLRDYYPNPQLYENYYLEGTNNRDSNNPTRSILWFAKQDENGLIFKQYNTAPESSQKDCHWDLLSWENSVLSYSQTHDGCDGNNKDVTFSTPIQLLPRYWDGGAWSVSGTTTMTTTKLDGSTGCTGTNDWTSTIIGKETITGTEVIHYRNQQNIDWSSGDDSPFCVNGGSLNWQEDHYLSKNIAVTDYKNLTSAAGLLRTVGGNLDAYEDTGLYDWDITMSRWALLPWGTAQEIPGVPNTGNDTASNSGIIYGLVSIFTVLAIFTTIRLRSHKDIKSH